MSLINFNFFDDPIVAPRDVIRGYVPDIPDTGWKAPEKLPMHYKEAALIGFDCETHELDFDKGAGWGRNTGYIVGVSVAALFRDGRIEACYLPVRHDLQAELNLPADHVFAFLRELLACPMDKTGANLQYDCGHLAVEGVKVNGTWLDVQIAEALLAEDTKVALDVLGAKYEGQGKETDMLYEWIRAAYPKTPSTKLRGHIWHAPVTLVGHYAEQDAVLPIKILQKQYPILAERGLLDVFKMECELTPLLVDMRMQGVTVDVPRAEELKAQLAKELEAEHRTLQLDLGINFNYLSSDDLGHVFTNVGIKVPRTDAGAYSIKKEWLTALAETDNTAARLLSMREKDKVIGTFLQGYIIDSHVRGKIYGSFYQTKGETNGTRSGRLASSKPNLQNLPSRSKLAKQVREVFIPHLGHAAWGALDYSQIEYRMLCHFAVGDGADEVRLQYNNDPSTDYHEYTQALVLDKTGRLIERKPIKNINFGLLYGMGLKKLGRQLGIDDKTAVAIFDAYHGGAPYVNATMDAVSAEVRATGQVRTIMGRISYFDLWQPNAYDEDAIALPYDMAIKRYGSKIKRAYDYKGVNRMLQGSAADVMKMGMVKLYQSGVFDVTGLPTLTVHDELDFSIIDDSQQQREAYAYVQHVMETAIPLRVPVKAEAARGANWGTTKDVMNGMFSDFK